MSDPIGQFRTAADRDAARSLALDVAWVAVDDAVAVLPGTAARVTAEVRRLIEEGTPWRADAFAILIYVLNHAHVYRKLRAGVRTYRGGWEFGIAEEEAVERALDGFDRVVRDVLDDPDPETRSLASLLLARISGEPALDRELLRLLAGDEPDVRARACLVEALLRLGEPMADDWPADDAPELRYRLAWCGYDDGAGWTGPEPPLWRWPAEEM